jgi:hypothetical protein
MKKKVWYARWLFKDQEQAMKALPDLHISCGTGENQAFGTIACNLDKGELLTITRKGDMYEVYLSFPYSQLRGKGVWISPSQAFQTYDLKGKSIKGDAYQWGSRWQI